MGAGIAITETQCIKEPGLLDPDPWSPYSCVSTSGC